MLGYSLYEFIPQLTLGKHGDQAVKDAIKQAPKLATTKDGPLYPVRPKVGESVGELIIPKLSAVLPIVEGTDAEELEKGVGHFRKSALPGEENNSVLSGHRDTVFRRTGELKIGDPLLVKTRAGLFTYTIEKTWIVDDEDRTVIVPHPGEKLLTLTTCYPFNWIGSAPERYIIQARLKEV
ncbi:class D sortase [Risungbinella massiliensis]|uniref:class D sortase n=1 Tax=Risungbinella massiliensis TaxID=1329796 RepID=UPI0005CC08FB|nr:class D sortase [Risungbinella massiliensis]